MWTVVEAIVGLVVFGGDSKRDAVAQAHVIAIALGAGEKVADSRHVEIVTHSCHHIFRTNTNLKLCQIRETHAQIDVVDGLAAKVFMRDPHIEEGAGITGIQKVTGAFAGIIAAAIHTACRQQQFGHDAWVQRSGGGDGGRQQQS
jgi:hypothetical protein